LLCSTHNLAILLIGIKERRNDADQNNRQRRNLFHWKSDEYLPL